MTLFEPEALPEVCKHGRTAAEVCPWCESVVTLRTAQNEPQAPYVAGSQTSFEASQAIKPDASKLRARVFDYIAANGPVSDEQIAAGLDMNPSTARPRRVELTSAGRIEKAGRTITSAGRSAWAWSTVPGSEQGK